MGSRGSVSGIRDDGSPAPKYGTEFRKVAQTGEIMFIKSNKTDAKGNEVVTVPMETKSRGRIYAVLDKENDVKHLAFYDLETGERIKQIDLKGAQHNKMLPHRHRGVDHDEGGTNDFFTPNELKVMERVQRFWKAKRKKLNM